MNLCYYGKRLGFTCNAKPDSLRLGAGKLLCRRVLLKRASLRGLQSPVSNVLIISMKKERRKPTTLNIDELNDNRSQRERVARGTYVEG